MNYIDNFDESQKDTSFRKGCIKVGLAGTFLYVVAMLNMAQNQYDVRTNAYRTRSNITGIISSSEFTTFNDGSHSINTYPGIANMLRTIRIEDKNNDGIVDKITQSTAYPMKTKTTIWTRTNATDYILHRREFLAADATIQFSLNKYFP